jgi:hypothetical protein
VGNRRGGGRKGQDAEVEEKKHFKDTKTKKLRNKETWRKATGDTGMERDIVQGRYGIGGDTEVDGSSVVDPDPVGAETLSRIQIQKKIPDPGSSTRNE